MLPDLVCKTSLEAVVGLTVHRQICWQCSSYSAVVQCSFGSLVWEVSKRKKKLAFSQQWDPIEKGFWFLYCTLITPADKLQLSHKQVVLVIKSTAVLVYMHQGLVQICFTNLGFIWVGCILRVVDEKKKYQQNFFSSSL